MKNTIVRSHLFRPAFVALCLCGVILFAGCSTTGGPSPILAQVAVQYATIKVLENNPDRAPRIVEIATFLEENAGDTQAMTVAILETAVRAQINWEKLDAADRILVDILITAVRTELVARLGEGQLTPEQALVVKQVAGWIRDAAILAQPGTS